MNQVRWGLNNTVNQSIGVTPSELFFNYRPRSKTEALLLNDVGEASYTSHQQQVKKRAIKVTKERQDRMKSRYDLRQTPAMKLKYAMIKKFLDKDRYIVGDITGCQRKQKQYTGVYPGEKLKLWETVISSDEHKIREEVHRVGQEEACTKLACKSKNEPIGL